MKDRIKVTVTKKGKSVEAFIDLDHYLEIKVEGQQSVIDGMVNSLIEQLKK